MEAGNYLASALFSIESISIYQFRNYLQKSWSFSDRIVGITGRNGSGKTNLLDAIYFLCFTKSYFQRSDALLVHHGAHGFRLEGRFDREGNPFQITAVLRETGKKEFRVNEQPCEKMADHIGNFPAVMIAPDDVQIITNGSEERRRFMDALFSQVDHQYLLQLMQYNKLLQQRNSLLKQIAETRQQQFDLLEVIDQQMAIPATYVHTKRKELLKDLLELVRNRYCSIAGENYDLRLFYESPLLQLDFPELLQQNRNRDIYSQRTHAGIHRDDIGIILGDKPFRQTASQGQRKSLLFAFKLAEFNMLKQYKGFSPLLLLDDVFEKLDEKRMLNLLQEVCIQNDGQVFVTDTHQGRIAGIFQQLGVSYQEIETQKE